MGAKSANIKLYVRRVFITDEFEDLMPRWLSFIKGVVDSEDLPLNVSREMLQTSKVLRVIKKKLVTKALEMIRKMAEKKKKKGDEEEEEKEGEEKKAADPAETAEDNEEYINFWKEFNKAIKLGLYEDSSNRTKLAKLLRFQTSKSGDNYTSLEKYISRMAKGQKNIYYISAENKEAAEKSPYLERFRKKGIEVLYYIDPIDEYAMPQLTEFKGFQFMGANKENLKFDDDAEEEAKNKKLSETHKKLTDWFKETLGAKVEKALEINPAHPIVRELKSRVEADDKDQEAMDIAHTLFDVALIGTGLTPSDPTEFGARLQVLMRLGLGVSKDAPIEEPEVVLDEPAEEKKEEEKKEEPAEEKKEL